MKCRNCNKNSRVIFDDERGEVVCSYCGVTERDHGVIDSEWNSEGTYADRHAANSKVDGFSVHEDSRQAEKYNKHSVRRTQIGKPGRRESSKVLPLYADELDRHTANKSIAPRNIERVNFFFNLFFDRLNIKSHAIMERAMNIYLKYHTRFSEQNPRKNIPNAIYIAPVCFYLAMKEFNLPLSYRDLQRVMRDENMAMSRNASNFFKIQFRVEQVLGSELAATKDPKRMKDLPIVFVSSIARKIGLPWRIEKKAMDIVYSIKSESWYTKYNPHDIAAGALWFVYFHLEHGAPRGDHPEVIFKSLDFEKAAKGNVITLRTVSRVISNAYKANQKKKGEEILVSVPKLSASKKPEAVRD